MTTLPATAPVQSPTSARDALADRYLARVAALGPRQWGELDAIGQRFAASDPVSVWHRARTLAAFAGQFPVLEDAMTVVGFVGMGIGDLLGAVRRGLGDRSRTAMVQTRTPMPSASSEARQLGARIATLRDAALLQPGGPGAAMDVLTLGLVALWIRHLLPAPAFERVYALVDPVIPLASL